MQRKLDASLIFSIMATGLLSFCGVVIETAGNITFPVLMKEFNVNISTVQWMTTGYLLTAAIIMPLSAYLKKNFTAKRLFMVAALLFLLGLIIDSSAPSFAFLVSGRVVQGVGAGIALPLMFNIILEQAPLNKMGLLMGIGTMITAIAPALGPTLGGLIVNSLGWRFIFIIIIPLSVISFILGSVFIKNSAKATERTKLDLPGFISIAVTFIGFILAFSNLSSIQEQFFNFVLPLAIGIIALVYFLRHSLRIEEPLINIKLFKLSKFTQGIGAYFIFQILALGLSFILPNYIQLVNGSTATIAGLLVLPGAALGAIAAPLSGRLLDDYGARKPLIAGALLDLIGILLFCVFAMQLSAPEIIIFYMIIMIGLGQIMGNIMTNSLSLLDKEDNADGNGLFNMVLQFSGAVGTSLVSAIVQFGQQISSAATSAQKFSFGAQIAFIFLCVLVFVGGVLIHLATRKMERE